MQNLSENMKRAKAFMGKYGEKPESQHGTVQKSNTEEGNNQMFNNVSKTL